VEASGNVMPWQEISIGPQVGSLALTEVLVGIGDTVKKGQVLARLDVSTIETDLESANAQLAEAEAGLAQASATLDRGRRLAPSGGVSQQDLTLYETQKRTAEARVAMARAQLKRQQIRLDFATLIAPDDGVISYSSASEGAIVQAGNELFRLIRQGRLEWRAEVKGEMLLKLAVGQEATITSPLGTSVKGRVRRLSPTIDLTTRNGSAYVDLPAGTNLKAGLHVTGTINVGMRRALVLPESAVLRGEQDGKVFKLNAENRVEAVEVKLGRTKDGMVEVLGSAVDSRTPVIVSGVQLLKTGELVTAAATTDADR
jgi:RND family efflux transporter MFP subunit